MIAIFGENTVFKLVCPTQEIADRMADEKETTIEIEEWVKYKMPTLVKTDDGGDQVVWVTRDQFDVIRKDAASFDTAAVDEDVPMA